jgi:mRNA-degrading endonuclease RelE of RelBE toxin-antitoxin system
MMYEIVASPDVEAAFRKMRRKDATRFEQILKKLQEIGENPEIGKPLRRPLQGRWRVHIGNYVLLDIFDTKNGVITLVKYAHHDEAY